MTLPDHEDPPTLWREGLFGCPACGFLGELDDHDDGGCPDHNQLAGLPPLPRAWYVPCWKQTQPWRVAIWHGGDEWGRSTLAIQLGPLGMLVIAKRHA